MQIKPFIIVPNLIEQPTWGGDYIGKLKKLKNPKLSKTKLGQSYELFTQTKLSTKTSTKHQPSIERADPTDPTKTKLISYNDKPFSISKLIKADPQSILGKKALKAHGDQIQILIKLTQAKGNSYQLHVKKPTSQWKPKPESWYYLEPGLVTLGIKPDADLKEYKQACQLINQKAINLSRLIKSKKVSLIKGRQQLASFIKQHNPQQFVNLVDVPKQASLDLSACGIHHSWEENEKTHPLGNVLYEVQKNVYDPVATIRSFDKGKIKDDGSIRPLDINDYFKHIDTSAKANTPDNLFTSQKILKRSSTQTIRQIFNNRHYSLQEFTFTRPLSNRFTTTSNSYHHLFIRQGNAKLVTNTTELLITQGYSVFIPASEGQYQLKPTRHQPTKVLKTYL